MRGDGSFRVERVVPAELVKGATDLALVLSPKEASEFLVQARLPMRWFPWRSRIRRL